MNSLTNTIQNKALENLVQSAPKQVLHAIKDASARVGVSFSYMLEQASAESSFKADAKAKTSSATGLYQFIESTWMNMVERHGAKYGVDTEGKSKSELLELRKDPQLASLMAAEFAGDNKAYLERNWAKGEKEIGSTELYFAHFMGAGGAATFLNARDKDPMQDAAVLFPKAAAANKNVFYDRATGQSRTMEEVYAFFDKKFSGENVDLPSAAPGAIASVDMTRAVPDIGDTGKNSLFASQPVQNAPIQHFHVGTPLYNLVSNPVEIMMMSQLALPFGPESGDKDGWF